MSAFRVMGCVETSIIHDFLDAVGVFLLRRRPPPRGWCSLLFFYNDPHGLPLFFADPLDITICVLYFFSYALEVPHFLRYENRRAPENKG